MIPWTGTGCPQVVLLGEDIDTAIRHAATIGKPFCVTVLDVGGNSKAAVRMDGAPQEE